MAAPLVEYLAARSSRTLSRVPMDRVFDTIAATTDDPKALAVSLGLPPEDGDVDPGSIAGLLVDGYLDALASDDGGVSDVAAGRAAREYRDRRYSVATTLGKSETEIDDAYRALDVGEPATFDRLMAEYYGA